MRSLIERIKMPSVSEGYTRPVVADLIKCTWRSK